MDVTIPSELVCHIPCNFCNILLAVSVPCSSLFDIVTVRCGHCTNLWSVNLAAAFQSPSWQDHVVQTPSNTSQENRIDSSGSSSRFMTNKLSMRAAVPSSVSQQRITNKRNAPEKRQRVPSAYNQFIKEEIQRIKVNNPNISHREAFSTAAKNWAHFPRIHFGLMLESNNQSNLDNATTNRIRTRAAALLNK